MPRQFDVVRNLSESGRRSYPLLLILQHDHIASVHSVIVAPLAATSAVPGDTRLHPSMTIAGQRYFMLTEDLAAMPRGDLGPVVGSAVEYRYEIIGALDLLFTGI